MQQPPVDTRIFILDLFYLSLAKGYVQRLHSFQRLRLFLFLLAYFGDLLEQQSVFSLDLRILFLHLVLSLRVFLKQILVALDVDLALLVFRLFVLELEDSPPMEVHPMGDLLPLDGVPKGYCRQLFLAHKIII